MREENKWVRLWYFCLLLVLAPLIYIVIFTREVFRLIINRIKKS